MTAIAATVSGFRSLADDTVRFQIDVEPRDAEAALRLFSRRGTAIALAALTDQAAVAADQTPNYGQAAKSLHTSGFFRSPDVWRAAGMDAEFLSWIREQACWAMGMYASECRGVTEAAHVRSVADGSGTGIKPPYCAVPLCSGHHRLQHDMGYSAVHPEGIEAFKRARIEYVEAWCKAAIKQRLAVDSLRDLEPARLRAWAEKHGVERYLPKEYA